VQAAASLGEFPPSSLDWPAGAAAGWPEEGRADSADDSLLHCVTPAPLEFGDSDPEEVDGQVGGNWPC
jgi:hypothetical protein